MLLNFYVLYFWFYACSLRLLTPLTPGLCFRDATLFSSPIHMFAVTTFVCPGWLTGCAGPIQPKRQDAIKSVNREVGKQITPNKNKPMKHMRPEQSLFSTLIKLPRARTAEIGAIEGFIGLRFEFTGVSLLCVRIGGGSGSATSPIHDDDTSAADNANAGVGG